MRRYVKVLRGAHYWWAYKVCCSLSNAKRSFYRAFNCIFGKVGRVAYENVVIELSKAKCHTEFELRTGGFSYK